MDHIIVLKSSACARHVIQAESAIFKIQTRRPLYKEGPEQWRSTQMSLKMST